MKYYLARDNYSEEFTFSVYIKNIGGGFKQISSFYIEELTNWEEIEKKLMFTYDAIPIQNIIAKRYINSGGDSLSNLDRVLIHFNCPNAFLNERLQVIIKLKGERVKCK